LVYPAAADAGATADVLAAVDAVVAPVAVGAAVVPADAPALAAAGRAAAPDRAFASCPEAASVVVLASAVDAARQLFADPRVDVLALVAARRAAAPGPAAGAVRRAVDDAVARAADCHWAGDSRAEPKEVGRCAHSWVGRCSPAGWAGHLAAQCLAYRWLAGWAAHSEPEAQRLAYRYSTDDGAAHSAARPEASQMADDRCAGYWGGRSTEARWEPAHFADGSAARCSAARRLQVACPADCLAERCFAAAQADLRSDLRSAVAHFQCSVAAALLAGPRGPS